jgi:hypothetical protein
MKIESETENPENQLFAVYLSVFMPFQILL